MSDSTLKQQIIERIDNLDEDSQRRVLQLLDEIDSGPKGVPATSLLHFVGAISAEELDLMERAVEEDCEKIDYDEW